MNPGSKKLNSLRSVNEAGERCDEAQLLWGRRVVESVSHTSTLLQADVLYLTFSCFLTSIPLTAELNLSEGATVSLFLKVFLAQITATLTVALKVDHKIISIMHK